MVDLVLTWQRRSSLTWQLSSKISVWSLWITLNIIDTITCSLGLPSPLEGLGLVVNPDARGGRHTSSARTARFGVPPSRVARRRPDVVSRFPLLAPEAHCGALTTPVYV